MAPVLGVEEPADVEPFPDRGDGEVAAFQRPQVGSQSGVGVQGVTDLADGLADGVRVTASQRPPTAPAPPRRSPRHPSGAHRARSHPHAPTPITPRRQAPPGCPATRPVRRRVCLRRFVSAGVTRSSRRAHTFNDGAPCSSGPPAASNSASQPCADPGQSVLGVFEPDQQRTQFGDGRGWSATVRRGDRSGR